MSLVFGRDTFCRRCDGKGCPRCASTGIEPRFDGSTYEPVRPQEPDSDKERLSRQLAAVKGRLADHQWHTLADLAEAGNCETQSASARLRDLRKARFGGYTIDRRYIAHGLFEYRLEPK